MTVGVEFHINQTIDGPQEFKVMGGTAITPLAGGGFAVVWRGNFDAESSFDWQDAYLRRYSADGTPLSGELPASAFPGLGDHHGVAVAGLLDGDLVVTYGGDYGIPGILARQFDPVTGGGSEQAVMEANANEPLVPLVVSRGDGGYVVIWEDFAQTQTTTEWDVYARRFDALGRPQGSEFVLTAQASGLESNPTVASLTSGGFVAAWSSASADFTESDVFARLFDATGQPLGTDFRLNTTVVGRQTSPSLAALDDGGFIATWSDAVRGGAFAQRYDADGIAVGNEFRLTSAEGAPIGIFRATGLPGGGFVGLYHASDGDGRGVFVQRYGADGSPIGIGERVNDSTAGDQTGSGIVTLAGGQTVVTWQGPDGDGQGVFGKVLGVQPSFAIRAVATTTAEGTADRPAVTEIQFAVTRTGDLNDHAFVRVSALNVAGGVNRLDYTDPGSFGASQILDFAPGERELFYTVRLNPDQQPETDEILTIGLSLPSEGYLLEAGASEATVRIRNDDAEFTYDNVASWAIAEALRVTSDEGEMADRLERARSFILSERDIDGTDETYRDAEYYILGLNASYTGDPYLAALALGTPLYNGLKHLVTWVGMEHVMRADPRNAGSAPGGAEAAYQGLADGLWLREHGLGPLPVHQRSNGEPRSDEATVQPLSSLGTGATSYRVSLEQSPDVPRDGVSRFIWNQLSDVPLVLGWGSDTVVSAPGARKSFSPGGAEVDGGRGNDFIVADAGADILGGGDGNDFIFAGDDSDYIDGGTGNDALIGGAGQDRIATGDGVDVVAGRLDDLNGDIIVDFSTEDRLFIEGASFDQSRLRVASGSAILQVDANGDGAVDATIRLEGVFDLSGFVVEAAAGGTRIRYQAGASEFPEIIGTKRSDRLVGTDQAERIYGFGSNDLLAGRKGDDLLDGGGGRDILDGGAGADSVIGGTGADVIFGGAGSDYIHGGGGIDILWSGAGADRFIFVKAGDSAPTSGIDTIVDFSAAQGDRIDLRGIDASTAIDGNQAFVWIGQSKFSDTAGELRFGSGRIEGDIDGDGAADLLIRLTGVTTLDPLALLL